MRNKIIKYLIAITLVFGLIYLLILIFKTNNTTNGTANLNYDTYTKTHINNIDEEKTIISAESEAANKIEDIKQENNAIQPIEKKKKDVVKEIKQEVVKTDDIKPKENVKVDVKEKEKEEIKEPVKEKIQKEEVENSKITGEQTQTKKTEEKEEQQIICNHSNSKYYNSKNEAIAEYERIINEWSDKWINNEIDDETYYKSCPDGYEIFSCPYCKKWTISLYY